jgi:3-hydroxyisobutyrate dehydrogenase
VAGSVGGAKVVITLLPNGKIVREAVDALRPHLSPGTILIEMSSSAPLGTRKLGEELIAAGYGFIDAPVSGGVKRAVDGTLAIMVGGDAATIDRVDPVLAAMGRSIFRTGGLGSVRTADDLAHGLDIATPLADLCAKLWDEAAENLAESADHTEILRYMERLKA